MHFFKFCIYFHSHQNIPSSSCYQTPSIYFQATTEVLNTFYSTNVADQVSRSYKTRNGTIISYILIHVFTLLDNRRVIIYSGPNGRNKSVLYLLLIYSWMEFRFIRYILRYIYVTNTTFSKVSLTFRCSQDIVHFGVKIRKGTFLATRITQQFSE